jgi:hypothetical protein
MKTDPKEVLRQEELEHFAENAPALDGRAAKLLSDAYTPYELAFALVNLSEKLTGLGEAFQCLEEGMRVESKRHKCKALKILGVIAEEGAEETRKCLMQGTLSFTAGLIAVAEAKLADPKLRDTESGETIEKVADVLESLLKDWETERHIVSLAAKELKDRYDGESHRFAPIAN